MTRKRTTDKNLAVSQAAAAPARRKAAPRARANRAAEPASPLAPAAAGQETAAPQSETPALATVYAPSYDEIANLAYSYWEARGCQGGCPEEDWIRAEESLRNRSASVAAA